MTATYFDLNELINHYQKETQKYFLSSSWFNVKKENKTLEKMKKFFAEQKNPFERSCQAGHFTGSCWLINPAGDKAALCFHKKLKLWLQLGGHCDGCPDLSEVSMKEAQEESGIKNLEFWPFLKKEKKALAFDFDIHTIPENKKDLEHLHLDVRFVIQAKESDLVLSDESLDLKWFAFNEIKNITQEESVTRQLDKFLLLSKLSKPCEY